MSPEPGSWWCWNMLKRVETCWNMAGPRSYSWLFQPLAGPRPANRLERWRRRVVLSGGCTKLRQFSYVFIEKISWKMPKTYEFCCFFWFLRFCCAQLMDFHHVGWPHGLQLGAAWVPWQVNPETALGEGNVSGRTIGTAASRRTGDRKTPGSWGVGPQCIDVKVQDHSDHALSHTYVIIWLYELYVYR